MLVPLYLEMTDKTTRLIGRAKMNGNCTVEQTIPLGKLGETMPVKRLDGIALQKLMRYSWPGNVRELEHVLERGAILAEGRMEIGAEEIRF